jgi:CRISPR system Cascade subunit CasD
MSTLLLRLAAPLQAWGSSSKFNKRMTEREPTKSGVIGMIAAALGRSRTDDISDLQSLKFGVRIDQEGQLIKDFHTARTFDNKQAFISSRYYLVDALFVVGLEGEEDLLQKIDQAIKNPVFPLYLGRRSCPPVGPVSLGIKKGLCLLDALKDLSVTPWQAADWYKKQLQRNKRHPVYLEIVSDAGADDISAYTIRDYPVSFNQEHRKYAFRYVVSDLNAVPLSIPAEQPTAHDPIAELEV